MGYALFAQRKIVLTSQLNSLTLQQTQRSNEQLNLATQTTSLQQQLSSMQAAQSLELADYYELLSYSNEEGIDSDFSEKYSDEDIDKKFTSEAKELIDRNANRESINAAISKKQNQFQSELDDINRQISQVSVKENAIEMEVKRLDTQVSAVQKELEAVNEAEGSAIDRATPKFNGVG